MGNSVSVIIPSWNRVISLERAIRSCLTQTVPVLEILVCDDGSTDTTEQMAKSFDDPRVKWCPGERGGRPAIPRNRGIRASQGDWLAFLDDDDEWYPEKIGRQLQVAGELSTGAVCTNAMRCHPAHGELGLLSVNDDRKYRFEDLLLNNHVVCSSMLVSRKILAITGGFPEQSRLTAMEDYALWLRVAAFTDIAFIAAPLVRYTDAPSQSIRKETLSVYRQRRIVLDDFIRWGKAVPSAVSQVRLVKRTFAAERRSYWLGRLFGRPGH